MDSAALSSWLNQTSGMSALVVGAVVLAGLLVGGGFELARYPLWGWSAAISARRPWMPVLFGALGVVVIDTMALLSGADLPDVGGGFLGPRTASAQGGAWDMTGRPVFTASLRGR